MRVLCSPTRRPSRRRTTTRSRRRSPGPGPRSSSSRRRSASARRPRRTGTRRSELFYPVSSRVFRRSRLRIPVKLLEHPVGLHAAQAPQGRRRAPPVAGRPELDDRLLRVDAPLVFTAHDILPRRTAAKHELWRRLFGRFARHRRPQRARPRPACGARRSRPAPRDPASGLPEQPRAARRRPHAPLARDHSRVQGARRRDRGGEADRRRPAARRGRSAGEHRRLPRRGRRAGGVAARLPLRRRRSTGRSATRRSRCSRTGPRSTRAGRCCARSGPAVPVVAYDVGGLGEPVRRFEAGRVVPPGDVDALTEAVRELLDDPAAARARAGRSGTGAAAS